MSNITRTEPFVFYVCSGDRIFVVFDNGRDVAAFRKPNNEGRLHPPPNGTTYG